jgi:uncharacterized protein
MTSLQLKTGLAFKYVYHEAEFVAIICFTIILFSCLAKLKMEVSPLAENVKIVEKKPIPSGAIMLYGLPDVGLVGLIATSYIISELDLDEIAYVDSDLLPPVVVLHEGLPHAPLRIYGNSNLIAAISEMAIPAEALHPVMRTLVEWGGATGTKMMISMGGIPLENRQDIKEPEVFGAASSKDLIDILRGKGLKILKEGFIVGPQALTMRYCAERKISAVALLAQSFYNYPDPEAAAMTIKTLVNITDLTIDVSKLLEKGEEIRLRARDIMKRTQRELTRMNKSQEYDIPLYV